MSGVYVDPFYWEFGYAEGDLDLQPLVADTLTATVSAQAGLGVVKPVSAYAQPQAGAVLNELGLNTDTLGSVPSEGVTAAATAGLEVTRLFFIAGEAFVDSTTSAQLDKTANAAAVAIAAVTADVALQKTIAFAADPVDTSVSAQADLLHILTVASSVTTDVQTVAGLVVGKPLTASGDAVVQTTAVALLGKRLDGAGTATAVTLAAAAIQKAMASSAAATVTTTVALGVSKNAGASAQSTTNTTAVLAVDKLCAVDAQAVATLVGRLLLIKVVPVENFGTSTFEIDDQQIFVVAELFGDAVAEVPQLQATEIRVDRIYAQPDYTQILATAEIVEDVAVDVTW